MKKFRDRLFACLLVAALTITSLYLGPASTDIYAKEKASEYEIYPNPQEISYQDGEYDISSSVNVVFEEGIDEATQNRLEEIIKSKGKTMNATDAKVDNQTNILVGVYGSKGYVDQYVQDNYSVDAGLFEHFGSHYVISDNGEICILGKDTDAAFYGITSLKHIFNQMVGSAIRNFTIKDYADTNIRGFIEGYYGIPWSNENRMSLMEFGGEFKMTSYVFAPKDDPYHSAKWRELYPADKLAEIAKMAAVGNASKCKFVWTIHPFRASAISDATYDADLQTIKAKFEQLYGAGVRQFGVLGDDAGNLPRNVIIKLMNDLQKWVDEKGDVYNLVFCPAGYNHAWQGNYSELNEYDAGFADDIKIFWTGEAVCQPVEVKTLDHFRNFNAANGQRRAPLFWLNWPVNDINMSRLMMGKGSLLHTDINPDDLAGVVTNPMQDAQASKVALFAVADYTWNIKGFDDDQSWEDSFKYIDADAAEALHTLAKHMSDPSPNNHGLVLGESEELKPLLDEFLTAYGAGIFDKEKAEALIAEFEIIKKACDDFHTLSKNEELKAELLPFTDALKDFADAAILLINTADSLENGEADEVWSNYSNAIAKLSAAKNHDRVIINGGTKKALPGSKRITPFITKLNNLVSGPVSSIIDDSKVITSLITNREDTPDGALEALTDNNEGTQVIWKNPNSTTAGTYIGLAYSRPITLNDVTFKMGQSGNPRDTFQSAKLQYTEDGKEWIDLEGSEYDDRRALVTFEDLDLQVKGIRLIATVDTGNMWLGCKDIIVNAEEETDSPEMNKTIIKPDDWKVYSGPETNLTDGSFDTGVWYNTGAGDNTVVGDFLGMNLGRVVNVGEVTFAVGVDSGDKWEKYHLEYSEDGENWTTFKSYEGKTSGQDSYVEDLGGVKAQYVRIVNDKEKGCWVKFGEFNVEQDLSDGTSEYVYTNVEALKEMKAIHSLEETHFAVKSGITLKDGEYIGLKLERIKDITNIDVDSVNGLTLQTSKNAVVWTDVTGEKYEDARYIRLINNSGSDVTFDMTTFAVESFEITPISIADKNVSFYGDGNGMLGFDKNRTTEVIWWTSQVAGAYVTYDLGQLIDLNSIALVSKDSAGDFPRHAKLSVSEDGETWKDVMFIGNQDAANEGEAENTDNIMDVLPIHDVSSNLKKVEGLDEKVRFIKMEITRTKVGADKWVRYTEIELNGGDMYLANENNPTVITDAQESEGNVPTNMIDGDVATTFRPVGDKAGSFTYFISEKTEIGKVKILQSPSTISNAKVTAEVVKDGKVSEVELGTLGKSLVEFNTSVYDHVLAVSVEWTEGNVPEIHEIITSGKVYVSADVVMAEVEKYTALLDGNYTVTSKDDLKAAIKAGKDLAEKGKITDGEFKEVKDALEKAEKALVATDALLDAIKAAEKEAEEVDSSLYTEDSYAAYQKAMADAVKEANALLEDGSAEAIAAMIETLGTVKDALVKIERGDVTDLQKLIDEYEKLDLSKYTEESRQALLDEIALGKAIIETGHASQEDVDAQVKALKDAFEALEEEETNPPVDPKDEEAPGVPTDLKVEEVEKDSVIITWEASKDNVGVAGYEIYVDGEFIGTVEENKAIIYDLVPGTKYVVTVKAYDEAGNISEESEELEFTTKEDSKEPEKEPEKEPGTDKEDGEDTKPEKPSVKPVETGDPVMAFLFVFAMFASFGYVILFKRKKTA